MLSFNYECIAYATPMHSSWEDDPTFKVPLPVAHAVHLLTASMLYSSKGHASHAGVSWLAKNPAVHVLQLSPSTTSPAAQSEDSVFSGTMPSNENLFRRLWD